jgi:hypothetical protein
MGHYLILAKKKVCDITPTRALTGRLAAATGERERMKLIIAQLLAILLEKWQSYVESREQRRLLRPDNEYKFGFASRLALRKQQSWPARDTLLIKLPKFWSEYGGDTIIIAAVVIGVFVFFLLAAYVITRF